MTSEFFDWRRNTEFWREKEHLDYKCKKCTLRKIIDFHLECGIGQMLDLSKFGNRHKSARDYQDNTITEFLTSNKYKSKYNLREACQGMVLRLRRFKANVAGSSQGPRNKERKTNQI